MSTSSSLISCLSISDAPGRKSSDERISTERRGLPWNTTVAPLVFDMTTEISPQSCTSEMVNSRGRISDFVEPWEHPVGEINDESPFVNNLNGFACQQDEKKKFVVRNKYCWTVLSMCLCTCTGIAIEHLPQQKSAKKWKRHRCTPRGTGPGSCRQRYQIFL